MTNEVRKPPREWWIVDSNTSGDELFAKQVDAESTMGALVALGDCPDITHVREVLPGDDSIRERTIPISDVKEMLEDFRSDAKRMRGEFHRLYEEINNLIKHIERENTPKQDEGK